MRMEVEGREGRGGGKWRGKEEGNRGERGEGKREVEGRERSWGEEEGSEGTG